ncbi:MAG: hypothetical protein JF615_00630, partial [Asticcacaulis sp.]|nr:hypothetical protein [Asticcacaulis sp.]
MDTQETVIFDSDDLKVSSVGSGSQTVFLTFNNYNARDQAAGFGTSFLRGRQYSVIVFINKQANWSQSRHLDAALAAVRKSKLFKKAKERIAYGASMGGFSALLLAGELGCVRALIGSPQISVDPRLVPFDTRFADEARKIDFVRPDARTGLVDTCRYYIVYDPHHDIDRTHIELIGDRPNIVHIPARFGGHRVLVALKEQGVLADLVTGFAEDRLDVHAILKRARRKRRESPTYLENLSRYCIAKGKLNYGAGVAALAFRLDKTSLTAYKAVSRLYLDTERYGDLIQASHDYLAHDPNERAALINLGVAAVKTADFAAAAAASLRLCARDDATTQDWFMYARMLVRSGDAAGALAACENGLARYPGDKHLDDLYQAL